ncbi:MAG TPA: CHAT domain-containing protein [Bryobacteraceae bacterium]|nr:CHAT domain-containing protein [Bryobacteraceae bacterium]
MPSAVPAGQFWRRGLLLLLALAVAVYGCGRLWSARQNIPQTERTPEGQLSVANYYAKLGNWDMAGPMFYRLQTEFADIGDSRNALYAHVSALEAGMETANLDKLSDELANTLAHPEVQRDLGLKQRCLEVKGNVDLNRDGVSARPVFEELESVAALRHDDDVVSRASGDLGIISFLEGNSTEATKRVLIALFHAYMSGDVGAQIRFLSLLGQGMVENHGSFAGLVALDRALSIARSTAGAGFPKIAMSGRASALTQLGRFSEAEQTVNLGLNYAREHHYLGYQVDMLAAAGQLARAEGKTNSAISFYLQAATLARQIHFSRGLAEVDAQLASLYELAGNLSEAEVFSRECVQVHRELGEIYELPHHLAIEANIQAAAGNGTAAEHTFEVAEQIVGTMLTNTPSTSVKRAVISAMSELFVSHFELAVRRGELAKAYGIIEEARGRVTADRLWAENGGQVPTRKPAEITSAEKKLALLQIQLLDATKEVDRVAISNSIADVENELAIPDHQPIENAPWERPSLLDLQKLIGPDELLAEYVLGDGASYCLMITATHVEAVRLPAKKVLKPLIEHFLEAVRKGGEARSEGHALYAAIAKPVLKDRAISKLVVIPDGLLYRLPFAALTNDSGQYLIESNSITYAPSGTVFALLRSRVAAVPRVLLAVGGVDYQAGLRTDMAGLFRGVTELRRDMLRDLPGTEDELREVQFELKDVNSVVLTRDQATETNFKHDANGPVAVMHLALHAIADTEHPDRAALIFKPDPKSGEDGLLQVREIQKLSIAGTGLVTLSACDTGVGPVAGEEGISSIVYAFLYAGAHSAVASYWETEDTASANLMRVFYRELDAGSSKADALREAQLQLLRSNSDMREPFYWAAFNLVGEGSDGISRRNVNDRG